MQVSQKIIKYIAYEKKFSIKSDEIASKLKDYSLQCIDLVSKPLRIVKGIKSFSLSAGLENKMAKVVTNSKTGAITLDIDMSPSK